MAADVAHVPPQEGQHPVVEPARTRLDQGAGHVADRAQAREFLTQDHVLVGLDLRVAPGHQGGGARVGHVGGGQIGPAHHPAHVQEGAVRQPRQLGPGPGQPEEAHGAVQGRVPRHGRVQGAEPSGHGQRVGVGRGDPGTARRFQAHLAGVGYATHLAAQHLRAPGAGDGGRVVTAGVVHHDHFGGREGLTFDGAQGCRQIGRLIASRNNDRKIRHPNRVAGHLVGATAAGRGRP